MWFGKNIMTKLGLALALAVPAFAAEVDPFYFKAHGDHLAETNAATQAAMQDQNQKYWNYLMSFKLWGTTGIATGRSIIEDTVGLIGTAKGDFKSTGFNRNELGGPVIIGGNIDLRQGGTDTKFTSGPVRTKGKIYTNLRNEFYGTVCAQGGYDGTDGYIKEGPLLTGTAATSGACIDDLVSFVKEDLNVPEVHAKPTNVLSDILMSTTDKVKRITAPDDGSKTYDIYIKNITFADEGELYVRVPNAKKLVRIFVDNLKIGNHPTILVEVPDGKGGYVTLHSKKENDEDKLYYQGNIMFYTESDINFDNTDNSPIQGTYISKKTITCGKNMKFAGQLIAEYLDLGAEINAGDFVFVPFDPPQIDPTALAKGEFKEDGINHSIPISLDAAAKNPVSFKYCFEVDNSNVEGIASIGDFNKDTEDPENEGYPYFPICGSNQYGTVNIPENKTAPSTPVYLNVKVDTDDEPTEYLKMKIYDLTGAVFPENNDDGIFYLKILNVSPLAYKEVEDHYDIPENSVAPNDVVAEIEYESATTNLVAGMTAADDPNDILNKLFDITVDETRKVVVITVKKNIEAPYALDYESTKIKQSYKVTLTLKDNGGATGCNEAKPVTTTIKITDVNEAPEITGLVEKNPDYIGSPTPFILYPKENLKDEDSVGIVQVFDVDTKSNGRYDHQEFEIIYDPNDVVPFKMIDSVIVVDGDNKLNYEKRKEYTFDVRVTNCEWDPINKKIVPPAPGDKCPEAVQTVTVKLQNVPEEPEISCKDNSDPKCKGPYDVLEHSSKDSVIYEFVVKDEDESEKLTVSVTDKNGVASKLFGATIKQNATTGDWNMNLIVIDDIDYETMNHGYDVVITVKDKFGETSSINRHLDIVDVNEAPKVTGVEDLNNDIKDSDKEDFTFYPKEKMSEGEEVGYVIAEDPDVLNKERFSVLQYSIIDPNDDIPFTMKDSSSLMVVKNASMMNFEAAKKEYTFEVKVENCEWEKKNGKYVKTDKCVEPVKQKVTVKIQNVPEGPVISCKDNTDPKCKGPYEVLEHSKKDSIIYEFVVTDEDEDEDLKVVVTDKNGKKSDLFDASITQNTTTGNWDMNLIVADDIDYETMAQSYDVKITVTDKFGVSSSINRTINIVDVNEAPVIAGVLDPNGKLVTTLTPNEKLPEGTKIGSISAKDPDTEHPKEFGVIEYFIDDPTDKIPFKMDGANIVVEDSSKLNFELGNNDYEFDVLVQNCEWEKNSSGKYEKVDPPKCIDQYQTVKVSIQDVEEPPVIIPECKGDKCHELCADGSCEECGVGESCHETCVENCDSPYGPTKVLTVSVNEHSPKNFEIMRYQVIDEDVGFGHKKDLTALIKNTKANTGAGELFDAKMEQDSKGNWSVVVYVADSVKLDYEKLDFDTHAVTIYVRDPQDPDGMYDSLLRVIKVVDVNEAPTADDAKFEPDENLPDSAVIGELKVVEPDTKNVKKFGHLEYSIIGKDETFVFAMDSNRVIVNDPSKMDYELKVHTYSFDVQIANCELNEESGKYNGDCLYDTAKVTVDIQNVNEPPVIVIDGPVPDGDDDSDSLCIAHCDTTSRGVTKTDTLTVGIKENTADSLHSPTGKILFQYHVVDEDTGHVAKATVDLLDVRSTIPSVKTKGTDLFAIDYKNGVITVSVKDEKKLDYEALRNAKTRNDPDPEYTMAIVVKDPDGMKDTLYRTIRVIDVNEKPLFVVEPVTITENNHIGDSLGHVEHPSDIDSLSNNPQLYDNGFKMTGGNTELFSLAKDSTDLMRVMLVAEVVLDCENGQYTCGKDSIYWVELTYGDTTLKTTYTDLRVPIKLIDLNEPPEIKTDTIGVFENSPKGTPVDSIRWFDYDAFDKQGLHFEIAKDPSGCFAIDSKTGFVTVKKDKCAGLDYEKNDHIDIEVSVTDMVYVKDRSLISGDPITVTKKIKVNIHDVNEPPSITDKTITVKEDTKPKTVVDTVRASDPDKDPKFTELTYTLIGGDTATFKIEPKTGALILKDTLDYEAKSKYYVTVRVDDGEFADTAKVTINIGNIKEWTKVKITEASTKRKTWEDPDVIYTSEPVREICWNQDGYDTCMTDLKIAKDTVVVVKWKNPSKDYAGTDTLRIYFNDATPEVSIKADTTLVTADNVFTIVEDMGDADTNIYLNKPKDSIFVVLKDPASKLDTAFKIEVGLEPFEASKVQGTLDKMTKIADNKIMRDETAKNVTETAVNSNQYKYSYKELIGKDTVTVSYMTDKDENPIKVPVVNEKGKVDSVEIITVTYKAVIDGKTVEVSYQADALTGEIFVKGPNGELMEQGASKKLYANKDTTKSSTKSTYSVNEGMFTITTGGKDVLGNDRVISYTVDKKGNMVKNTEGDAGYSVTYSFVNKYGNVATETVFIVVDQVGPKVEILSPVNKEVIRSNSVKVVWTVDGVEQDTLVLQGLEKGPNVIVRFYRDKAGNEASDTVFVMMKDSKDVDIAVEQPVTEISIEKIEEYYAANPPKKGETFAVSIKNPATGEEVETLIGGSFKTKEGSGKEPYPGVSGSKHLGPTLALDVKVPTANAVGGMATLDDIVSSDGYISLNGVDAENSVKISVQKYVEEYCEKDFELPSDYSKVNLYDTKLHAQIWVYTSLGNFVDYFNFTQDLNDPEFTDDAGLLKMYFEMKPDKEGFVKADNGKQYATGAFVYKVQATVNSKARCTIPNGSYGQPGSLEDGYDVSTRRKGEKFKNSDELLKSFGYRRPKHK